MHFFDDLDMPNTQPGLCPDCGQPANIWAAVSQQWECSFCNWQGRNPTRPPVPDINQINEVCF